MPFYCRTGRQAAGIRLVAGEARHESAGREGLGQFGRTLATRERAATGDCRLPPERASSRRSSSPARYQLARLLAAQHALTEAEETIREVVLQRQLPADKWAYFGELFGQILAARAAGDEASPTCARPPLLVRRWIEMPGSRSRSSTSAKSHRQTCSSHTRNGTQNTLATLHPRRALVLSEPTASCCGLESSPATCSGIQSPFLGVPALEHIDSRRTRSCTILTSPKATNSRPAFVP